MNIYDRTELSEMEDQHDFMDKVSFRYALVFILACLVIWFINVLTPRGHFREVLLCLAIALVVSGFILWFILEAARIIFL